MIRHRTLAVLSISVTALAVLTGCSSSSGSSDTTTATTQPTTQPGTNSPSSSSAATTTSAGSTATTAGGAGTSAPATDDKAAITTAFTTFFDGVNPDIDAKVAVLENGETLRSMIVDAAANPQFQQLSTTVNSVDLLSDSDCAAAGEVSPCALVKHDMFVGGLPAMVGIDSHAVKIDGVWKVSAKSWCAVVALGGATCPPTTTG